MRNFTLTFIFVLSTLLVLSQTKYKYNKSFTNDVIFKIKYENKNNFLKNNTKLRMYFDNFEIKKIFPNHKPLSINEKINNPYFVDLTLIYKIKFDDFNAVNLFINDIMKEGNVEYAVPEHIDSIFYVPNDEAYLSQYYLNNLKILEAWDISKGDTTTIIGITDTGIDIDHEDLNQNIYRNVNDPIDGIDNDQDGYIDNYWGWDLGENDNNPQWDSSASSSAPHGVWVSGCASAVADNGVGLAGIGYRTKIMPVKISNASTSITKGYEGIVYAADHGCNIINCSWGSTFGNEFGQDIVNYATYNRNALVVAAAGNNGEELEFYPASYDNVLSVGASNIDDIKWNHSNYAVTVDVMAPGENVRMTKPNNSYINGWGTSFASPMVAGCAGIVKSHYDTLNALQIGEMLRITCDNIDTVAGNEPYADLMGRGRINLYRALTDEITPSIRYKNVNFLSDNDTLKITGDFVNYLKETNNLNVLMTCNSPYIQLINSTFNAGYIGELDTVNNNIEAFTMLVDSNIPIDENIYFKLNYIDGTYSDFQLIKLKMNESYVNIDTNNIKTTIANNALIAYTSTRDGIGYDYKTYKDICYEMGIIIGSDTNKVEDCVRSNNDFFSDIKAVKYNSDTVADQIILSEYINRDSSVFNISIKQKVYAWDNTDYQDFIFVEYQIINNIDTVINNLRFGLFADWDILNYSLNKVGYYSATKLSYAYYTGGEDIHSGFQVLSDSIVYPYAFDNIAGGGGGIDITNGFTDVEKYTALSNTREMAGLSGLGNDICNLLSCGPYNIQAFDTIRIVYAIHSAESLNDLITSSINAQVLYDSIFPKPNGIELISAQENSFMLYPNPAKNNVQLIITNEQYNKNTNVFIYDIYGKLVKETKIQNTKFTIQIEDLEKGVYFVRVGNGSRKFIKE